MQLAEDIALLFPAHRGRSKRCMFEAIVHLTNCDVTATLQTILYYQHQQLRGLFTLLPTIWEKKQLWTTSKNCTRK